MSDLISRQAAIDALDRIFDRCEEIEAHLPEGDPDRTGYKMYPDYMTVWKYLHQLPSAQPEQNNLMADVHKRLINETGCKAVCRNEQWWGRGSNDDSDAYNRGFQDGANYAMERIENHIDELLRRKK